MRYNNSHAGIAFPPAPRTAQTFPKPARTEAAAAWWSWHESCQITVSTLEDGRHVRILLADDDAERAGAVARVLAADPGLTVLRLPQGVLLADAISGLSPDIVLVDMARPDRDALEGIRQVSAQAPRPVVLFVDQDDPAFMEEAIGAGVCSYNVLDLKPPDVKPILRAATALFRHRQAERDARAAAETRLQEREIV